MKNKFIIIDIVLLTIALYFVIVDNLELTIVALLASNGLLIFTNDEKEI